MYNQKKIKIWLNNHNDYIIIDYKTALSSFIHSFANDITFYVDNKEDFDTYLNDLQKLVDLANKEEETLTIEEELSYPILNGLRHKVSIGT